jgi:hypothetical protein
LCSGREEEGVQLVHLQANLGSPVGGQTVIRHLEMNVCPLTVRLSRGLVVTLFDFFNPPSSVRALGRHLNKRKEAEEEIGKASK